MTTSVKELIKVAQMVLIQANEVAEEEENKQYCIDTVYGFPLHYCPDELLKKYMSKYEKMNVLNPAYDHTGVKCVKKELDARSAHNIKVIRGE